MTHYFIIINIKQFLLYCCIFLGKPSIGRHRQCANILINMYVWHKKYKKKLEKKTLLDKMRLQAFGTSCLCYWYKKCRKVTSFYLILSSLQLLLMRIQVKPFFSCSPFLCVLWNTMQRLSSFYYFMFIKILWVAIFMIVLNSARGQY